MSEQTNPQTQWQRLHPSSEIVGVKYGSSRTDTITILAGLDDLNTADWIKVERTNVLIAGRATEAALRNLLQYVGRHKLNQHTALFKSGSTYDRIRKHLTLSSYTKPPSGFVAQ